MSTLKLVSGPEAFGDQEHVIVDAGSEADKLWRGRGYRTEAETAAEAKKLADAQKLSAAAQKVADDTKDPAKK